MSRTDKLSRDNYRVMSISGRRHTTTSLCIVVVFSSSILRAKDEKEMIYRIVN